MFRLRIQPFENEVPCGADETILVAALRGGLHVTYGCRTGGCSTCKMRVVSGEVDDRGSSLALSPDERAQGWFLPCVSRPRTDCIIDGGLDDQRLVERGRPQTFTTELVRNEHLGNHIYALRLRLLDDATIRFTAGQFVNVEIPGTSETRTYSIASAPSDSSHLELLVKRRPQGLFSSLLDGGLALGARLRVVGPFGQLRIRLSHRPIIMVASGSGLAPMLSMLRDLVQKGNTRPVRLFYRQRSPGEVFAHAQLAEIQRAMPVFEYVSLVSTTTETLAAAFAHHLPRAHDHDAYLGGSRWCIESTLPVLLELGVRRRNVYFDVFSPAR